MKHVRTDLNPPPVAPVADSEHRPMWSVMIPTFNCAEYLRTTLEGVLAQDPGPTSMQIEVVDDCSTKDDPERVVNEVGRGRVRFYRKPQNAGAIANFNSCIERSRGQLVHILHGDDVVYPGFYDEMGRLATTLPECAFIGCRAFYIDEQGVIASVSGRVKGLENAGRNASDFYYYGSAVMTPGAVVRRSFYEDHGGFLPSLVHTADCEMWSRAASLGGGIVTSKVLCGYRVFTGNDTSRLMRSAENLRDVQRLHAVFASRHPDFDPDFAKACLVEGAWGQCERFHRLKDHEALAANVAFYRSISTRRYRLMRAANAWLRTLGRNVAFAGPPQPA